MKRYWKSLTIWSLLPILAAMPEYTDPLWTVIADAGLPPEWVARAKLAAVILGAIGVVYGRKRATGPLV